MVRQRVQEVEINRTMQALYDFIVSAVRDQGRPSMDPTGLYCMYRSEDGAKCAVGHLIADSAYREKMEGQHVADERVWKVVTKNPLVKAAVKANGEDDVEEFLWLMQQAHDQAAADARIQGVPFVTGFLNYSRGVGKELKLDTKEAA